MNAKTLHITNGDSVLPIMREAGLSGELLPWRDVLHEGRVLADDDLAKVSAGRATVIANYGWGDPSSISQSFIERDAVLLAADSYDEVVLWFEHDLYDQLQLLQLLNWFDQHPHPRLSLIQHDDYLGMQTAEQVATLTQHANPVSQPQLKLARTAWAAFTGDTPGAWAALLDTSLDALPHLAAAVERLLAFLPSPDDQLDLNQRRTLTLIEQGITAPDLLFAAWQRQEAAMFMGDSSYWVLLEHLLSADPALLESCGPSPFARPSAPRYGKDFLASRVKLSELGQAALKGQLNQPLPPVNTYIGGWQLSGAVQWYWDAESSRLTARNR